MTIAETVDPTYGVSLNYISDLGVRAGAVVFNASIILRGLTILVTAWFLLRMFQDRILTIAAVVAGIGEIGVGSFTEDFGGIHSIVSFITFVFAALSAILAITVTGVVAVVGWALVDLFLLAPLAETLEVCDEAVSRANLHLG